MFREGSFVEIVCYDGASQVKLVRLVVAYDQGLLTVEEPEGHTTIYNLRSIGLLRVSEVLDDEEEPPREPTR